MDEQSGVTREMTIEEGFEQLRNLCTQFISLSENWFEAKHSQPVIQEIILARRHVEDARMRLGVANTKLHGIDPWAKREEEK